MNISEKLFQYSNKKYRDFSKKLITTKFTMLGVKTPIIKKTAKELLKQYDYQDILNNISNDYYEEILLEGIIIANSKIDINNKIDLIDKYITKIDNWAICDTFCASLKCVAKNKDRFKIFIDDCLKSKDEFRIRVGIILLLDYYLAEDEYLSTLKKIAFIKSDYYYVNMAIGWLISESLIKYFEETTTFLLKNRDKINPWVYNKGLQKARESKRLCQEEKDYLKKMKI